MSLTLRVAIGLVAGLLLGFAVSSSQSQWLVRVPAILEPIGTIFVNAIRVAVIPLVVSSLIAGAAAGEEDTRSISRIGGRALALILSVLVVAALFALAFTFPLIARLNIDSDIVARMKESAVVDAAAQGVPPSFAQWLSDLVPVNVFKAAADGALLPLMVISAGLGLALTQVERERRAAVVRFFHGIADAFVVLVSYIVKFAPIGVFALAAPLAARMGLAAARALVSYIAILSAAIAVFTVLILYPAAVWWGRMPLRRFTKAAAPAQAVAFSSRSSLASLPAVYEGARAGLALPERIYSLFLPLAASVFRVGAVMVPIVGVLFLEDVEPVITEITFAAWSVHLLNVVHSLFPRDHSRLVREDATLGECRGQSAIGRSGLFVENISAFGQIRRHDVRVALVIVPNVEIYPVLP